MEEVFYISLVNCTGCKFQGAPQGLICKTKADIAAAGSMIHKASKTICHTPQLVIIYSPALVSDSIVNPKENGHKENSLIVGSGDASNK